MIFYYIIISFDKIYNLYHIRFSLNFFPKVLYSLKFEIQTSWHERADPFKSYGPNGRSIRFPTKFPSHLSVWWARKLDPNNHRKKERNSEKMEREKKKDRRYNVLAFTGSAALLALAINLAISAINAHARKRKRRGLSFPFLIFRNFSSSERFQLLYPSPWSSFWRFFLDSSVLALNCTRSFWF